MKGVTSNLALPQPPKLLDQLRRCIRGNHYSIRTERAYVYWARWYIRFHGLRHSISRRGGKIDVRSGELQDLTRDLLTRIAQVCPLAAAGTRSATGPKQRAMAGCRRNPHF